MADIEMLVTDVSAEDPHFVSGVMAKIEQRRFRRELIRTGVLAGAAIILLMLVMPRLDIAAMSQIAQEYRTVIAAVLIALTFAWPRLSRS